MTLSTPTSATPRLPLPSVQISPAQIWRSVRRWTRLSHRLGIDLGTANTTIYKADQGIVLREPSVVAINRITNQPVAFGQQAKDLIGRNPKYIDVVRPVRIGVVTEFELTELMLGHFLQLAQGGDPLFQPHVHASCAFDTTNIERHALQEVVEQAGSRTVSLVDQAIAAAAGVGLPLDSPTGMMIVDIGAGTTKAAVISRMGTVVGESIPAAGDALDQMIHEYVKHTHHLVIGDLTAEELKLNHGSAIANPDQDDRKIDIPGCDPFSGQFTSASVTRRDLREAMSRPLHAIVETVKRVLELTPPELVADIADRGIVLTGGGSLLPGLDQLLSREVNIFVQVARDPLNAVALGTGYLIEHNVPCSELPDQGILVTQ